MIDGACRVPTFLFSDIEGSTLLWERYPDEMTEAMGLHNRLLDAVYLEHRGNVFKTVGDEYCVVFDDPADALSAADAAQSVLRAADWPQHCPIRVRIAVHTGAASASGSDYFGPTLNRVARLVATAHGGQTVVSGSTAGMLPPTCRMRLIDLGEHRLRDLLEPLQLYQLPASGDFPPLKTLNVTRTNLPCQSTSFIGRQKELDEVRNKLRKSRLVTLTGLGGTGKTRLALQVSADEVEREPDGVWLVDFSPVSDPAMVPAVLASAVDVGPELGPLAITQALHGKRMLLVLDGCEHVIESIVPLVESILTRCPVVRVLATSREVLGLPGETVVRLASLPAPRPGENHDMDAVLGFDSVRLFEDRAKAVRPEFEVTERNAPSVGRLCSRLEGIPLAIELAAARVRAMPVEQVEARVADRFGFLKGSRRSVLPRQQTLRALIDWSYDLLAPSEQKLLRRLSVFCGGCSLEAVDRVCSDCGQIDGEDVLDLLTSLVDKSLASFEESEGDGRYRLLDTVRQYAADRLAEDEDPKLYQDRHADTFLQILEDRLTGLHSHNRAESIRKLREDIDNIVAGLEWGERNPQMAVRLTEVMHLAWPFFHAATSNRWRLGLLTRVLELWVDKLPERCVTTATYLRCLHLALAGQREEARSILQKLWESGEAPDYTRERLNPMGYVHWLLGDTERALSLFRQAEETAGDDLSILAYSTGNQGSIALCQGRLDDAERHFMRSLEAHRKNSDTRASISTMSCLAKVAWERGETARARQWFHRYSRLEQSWGYPAIHARQARDAARVVAERDVRHAAMLWGAAQAMDEQEGPLADPIDAVGADFAAVLRKRLGEEAFEEALALGVDSLPWARAEVRRTVCGVEQEIAP